MQKIAILDNGEGVPLQDITGNAVVGVSLDENYNVVGAAEEACST